MEATGTSSTEVLSTRTNSHLGRLDGHQSDPLASINLKTEDYAWLTEEVVKVAEIFSKGRVISTLEGGYDLAALCESVAAHIMALKPTQS